MDARADRRHLFSQLSDASTVDNFFERVVDEVDWTVEGTHPLAGRFTSKAEFRRSTISRLSSVMRNGFRFTIRNVFIDQDVAVVEMQADAVALDGAKYDGTYCWVCRFESAEPGARIVQVRAYLDSAMVSWTLDRNERPERALR